MITKFDIGQKVYFDLPYQGWGWIESIKISSGDHIVYEVRYPHGEMHYKLEQALREAYEERK